MSVRTRLKRIERHRGEQAGGPQRRDIAEEDWLEWFSALDEQGAMNHEPDFSLAVTTLREAIEKAAKIDDPPFYPPDDFEPALHLSTRRKCWRGRHHYPGLNDAILWPIEMLQRTFDGIPPVSEVEFAELASWFEKNCLRIGELEEQSFPIVIDGQEIPDRTNIRYGLTWSGPRCEGAGRVAQHVRMLRELLGDA